MASPSFLLCRAQLLLWRDRLASGLGAPDTKANVCSVPHVKSFAIEGTRRSLSSARAGAYLPLPAMSQYPACTTGPYQKDHSPPWPEAGCCCPHKAWGSASASSKLAHEFLPRYDALTERNLRSSVFFPLSFLCVYVCLGYFSHGDKTP